MDKIETALLSVSNKEGILEFAEKLSERGIEIFSTGGTERLLVENGIRVTRVSDYIGFPEIMDGRVKTLHPKIHGGILARRDITAHTEAMKEHEIKPIDMVVVNLYPFEKTILNKDCRLEEAIENIDIGGPSMLRSAAKNHRDVLVIVDPEDYNNVLSELESGKGTVSIETRLDLAARAFAHIARYDSLISGYLEKQNDIDIFPTILNRSYKKAMDLRYGENPHQKAAFYKEIGNSKEGICPAHQIHGKELSYNNILDLSATVDMVSEFEETTAVVVKHTNPCGAASSESLADAYRMARETDPLSAFGGIVGLNRIVDAETAKELVSTFLEVVAAPDFSADALKILKQKKNLRLLRIAIPMIFSGKRYNLKTVAGGLLFQENDTTLLNEKEIKVVTSRKPEDNEMAALIFAWKVAKHVKSNAIVLAENSRLIAVGAGQMSRVDSSKIAVMKATRPIKGGVMASDAFFPFRDAIDTAAEAGVTAIVQPGGSMRDQEVITAADEHGLAMIFTGIRHFRH